MGSYKIGPNCYSRIKPAWAFFPRASLYNALSISKSQARLPTKLKTDYQTGLQPGLKLTQRLGFQ